MSIKKISELSTKSFLGGAGAAANSYVLINYEDNSTSEPITYKATIQELGKAIANDLQLYKKTQDGAVTTSVNNGAYVDGSAKDFIELDTPKNVQISESGELGYFSAADSDSWTRLDTGVSAGALANAVNGLVSANDLSGFVSANDISGFVSNDSLASTLYNYVSYTALESAAAECGLASTGYVNNAVSGLASIGDLPNVSDLAYISTSDTKPCIRNIQGTFQGFLSTT